MNNHFVYKKIPQTDQDQLFYLIDTVLSNLENPNFFYPYEKWEFENMFNAKNYAYLWGAYDGKKLVASSQLYVFQGMPGIADFKQEYNLESNCRICELGGNLVLPGYRKQGIATRLLQRGLGKAKSLHFTYVISTTHPDNIGAVKAIQKTGLDFVKTTTLSNGYLMNLYMQNLKTESIASH